MGGDSHSATSAMWVANPLALVVQLPVTQRLTHKSCACCSSAVCGSRLFQLCLPVWPSTRFQWPPPRSMRCGGGSRESGVCS